MKWIEISVTAKGAAIDKIAALLDDYSGNGIIEDLNPKTKENTFTFFCFTKNSVGQIKADVEEKIFTYQLKTKENLGIKRIFLREITEDTWTEGWQQYVEPIEIVPKIVICPKWKSYDKKSNERVIIIDSKQSFGTGDHVTTQCCAKLLSFYSGLKEGVVLDIGTGTGILLLLAEALGFSSLVGIDLDEEAVFQARDNCAMNGVKADIIHGNLSENFCGKASLIMANLTVDPLKVLLPVIGQKLVKHGILIISGIVDERYEEILPYIHEHWCIKEHIHCRNWHTFALVKP